MNYFKYLSPISAECFFETGTITYSKPNSYNDPFEFHPSLIKNKSSNINKQLNVKIDISAKPKGIDFFAPDQNFDDYVLVQANILDSISAQIVTTCYSHSESHVPVNILMWSHYAASHRGIAIKLRNNTTLTKSLTKIVYVEKQPIFDLAKIEKEKNISLSDFYFKFNAWEYEREYRHARLISDCKGIKNNENLFSHPLEPELIDFIIVGLNANDDLRRSAIEYGVKNKVSVGFVTKSNQGFGFQLTSGAVTTRDFGILLQQSFKYEAAKT